MGRPRIARCCFGVTAKAMEAEKARVACAILEETANTAPSTLASEIESLAVGARAS